MVEINHRERFIRAKILYYGPAAGGKTTNLQALHRRALEEKKLELVSVNTAQDRTILFDLLPLTTPAFRSYQLRFQIVAVPGQRLYAATRKMLLKNADSVVFVANSATDRWEENLQSMKEMTEYLLSHGMDPSTLPVIFQYNKRDLPDTTAIEIMERGMNARQTDSYSSIATREEGVLETFAAALRRTMTELSTRYNIGESLADPRSATEWTARTMRETFGVTDESLKKDIKALEPEPQPELVSRQAAKRTITPPTVVTVKTPSQPRTSLTADTGQPSSPGGSASSAAAAYQDPIAARSMLESYAEAASGLGEHIGDIQEEKDEALSWLEELSAVADSTRGLLTEAGESLEHPLETLVSRMALSLRTSKASLSIMRPDDLLDPVILYGLDADPIQNSRSPGGQPLGPALVRSGKATVQVKGDPGPLDEAIDRAGSDCVAAVALPLAISSGPLGLLMFFLPQEAAVPNRSLMEYLERASVQLTAALDATSNMAGSDRLERCLREAFAGRTARQALAWTEEPLSQIEATVARLASHKEAPAWLSESLGPLGRNILKLKSMRQAVAGLGDGILPPKSSTRLDAILRNIEGDLRESLEQSHIKLQVEVKSDLPPLNTDPLLLWSVIFHWVEDARRSLSGISTGGIIRILTQAANNRIRLAVFDNALALAPRSAPDRYLAWPLDRRFREIEMGFVQPVIAYLKARSSIETRDRVGTIRTLLLPLS